MQSQRLPRHRAVRIRSTLPSPTTVTGPRIVSMVPAATLNLVLMGAADHLVGVTKYDRLYLPDNEKDLPVVGDYEMLDYEQLVKLKPTVLVIQKAEARIEPRLRETAAAQHFELVNVQLETIDDIWATARQLGRAAGKGQAAERAILLAQAQLKEVAATYAGKPRPRVLYVMTAGMVAGDKTIFGEMIELAGGKNVGAEVGRSYPEIGKEGVVKLSPDVLLIGAPDEPAQQPNDPRLASLARAADTGGALAAHLSDHGRQQPDAVAGRRKKRPRNGGDDSYRGSGGNGTGGGGPTVTGTLTRAGYLRVWGVWLLIAGVVFVLCLMLGQGDFGTRKISIGWPDQTIREIRVQRVLAAGIVGMALAAAGVALQALLRNPLAEPYVLGISSGSAVGVMLWLIVTGPFYATIAASPLAIALVTAGRSIPRGRRRLVLLTCILVFAIARRRGGAGGIEPVTLLLVGVVVSAMNAAVLMVVNAMVEKGLKADLASYMLGSILEGDLNWKLLASAVAVLLARLHPRRPLRLGPERRQSLRRRIHQHGRQHPPHAAHVLHQRQRHDRSRPDALRPHRLRRPDLPPHLPAARTHRRSRPSQTRGRRPSLRGGISDARRFRRPRYARTCSERNFPWA